jgi:hypothetical protein
MRASGLAGLGAGPKRVVKNGLDRARASTALGAAAEAPVDLLGMTWNVLRGIDGVTDIVVAQEVTGTNNHEKATGSSVMCGNRYGGPRREAKGKNTVFKQFQTEP